MTGPAVSLGIVIPTRNRADLAISACESLLAQTGCRYHVFISDNSTETADLDRLANYCARADPRRVTYLRPPTPLSMPTHWDWAIRRAMECPEPTHFTVHYDRRITKPNLLELLCEVLTRHPQELVTWPVDQITQDLGRSLVWQTPWDDRLYSIRTSRVVEMTIQGRILHMGQAFPVLSNCAVPRCVLDRILREFGDICDSTGPDSCFTYRFCATQDRYLHLDRPLGVVYASHRSAGGGYLRGSGGDFHDFTRSMDTRSWLHAAPIPGLNLGQNMLFHEYELVRRATGHPAFTPIDWTGYLGDLGYALRWIDDEGRAAAAREILLSRGWSPENVSDPFASIQETVVVDDDSPPTRLLTAGLALTVGRLLRKSFHARSAAILFAADYLRIAPLHICGFQFRTDAEALRRALRYPRRRVKSNSLLYPLEPVDMTNAAPSAPAAGGSAEQPRDRILAGS